MYCVGGSLKNLCHFEMGGGGVWQMLTSSGGGGRSMLTVADRGEGGIKFAKILLTSYVNAPLYGFLHCITTPIISRELFIFIYYAAF